MVLTHYTSPCKGCQDRKVTEDFNCHTSCPAYLDFRAKVDEANAQKPIASDISSYTERRIYENRKARSRRIHSRHRSDQ